MPGVINNRTTTDRYEDTQLLKANIMAITVQVNNAAVMYQLMLKRHNVHYRGEEWEPSEGVFLLPGQWYFTQADFDGAPAAHGIRFRSVVSGTPAQVTASA